MSFRDCCGFAPVRGSKHLLASASLLQPLIDRPACTCRWPGLYIDPVAMATLPPRVAQFWLAGWTATMLTLQSRIVCGLVTYYAFWLVVIVRLCKIRPKQSWQMKFIMMIDECLAFYVELFTAQCTLVHMRGLGIACRPSVRLSVCNVGGLWSHRLEILETNYTDN